MRKRFTAFTLALVSALLLALPCAQTVSASSGDYIAAVHTRSNGQPYYIMVNRAQSTVTVYGLDENNYYTIPVKAMICSTGRTGHATPTGTFTIGGRWDWLHMIDGSYGQYATQISGNILFHSVCYSRRDPSTLLTYEYNGLGAPASLGCVRLQTVDAKWIFDNCARGTRVTIYDGSSPGPLGKPTRLVDHISAGQDNGWDPTDPRDENPWNAILTTAYPDVRPGAWYYEDVQYVLEAGIMAGSSGRFDPEGTVTYRDMAKALYQMSGEEGLDPLLWARQKGLLDGLMGTPSRPDSFISRQALITMLYRYETGCCRRTATGLVSLSRFRDDQSVAPYATTAMRWAVGNGLIQGGTGSSIHPTAQASRAQLAAILHRYCELHGN